MNIVAGHISRLQFPYQLLSFIEAHKNLVIIVFVIFILLLLLIMVLIYNLVRILRMKQELCLKNSKLTSIYQELSTSEEQLKQQLERIEIIQQSLIESEERYELLFQRMLNGFAVFEPIYDNDQQLVDLKIITFNPSFENQTKKSFFKLEDRTWIEVFGVIHLELERFEEIINSGEAQRFEYYSDEDNLYYLVNAFRIQDKQIGIVVDNITDYKLAIEEVEQWNQELEGCVITRTNDLKEAFKELEAFTYTVSHDLKAPLRSIDSYSKIILEDYEKELNDDIISMLHSIRIVSAEMVEMIHQLLLYSTTSRTVIQTEKVNMKEIYNTVFGELKLIHPHRRIELRIETGLPDVTGDKILLKQVVSNILSNAIKFTRDKELSLIIVGATITENQYVFYTKDNGVGFNMIYSGKLFHIFQRLHTSEEFEGSGIGLVTIKKILEKHGGRAWIDAKLNEGATIFFTLPINYKQG